jgi:hypothetical protein
LAEEVNAYVSFGLIRGELMAERPLRESQLALFPNDVAAR